MVSSFFGSQKTFGIQSPHATSPRSSHCLAVHFVSRIAHGKYAFGIGMRGAGLNFEKTVITSGLDVGVEVANLKTAKANASIQLGVKELALLSDMISALMEQFKDSLDISQKFFSAASNAINHHTSTGVALARSMRGAHSA